MTVPVELSTPVGEPEMVVMVATSVEVNVSVEVGSTMTVALVEGEGSVAEGAVKVGRSVVESKVGSRDWLLKSELTADVEALVVIGSGSSVTVTVTMLWETG